MLELDSVDFHLVFFNIKSFLDLIYLKGSISKS